MKKTFFSYLFLASLSFGCSGLISVGPDSVLARAMDRHAQICAFTQSYEKDVDLKNTDFVVFCNDDSPIDPGKAPSMPYKTIGLSMRVPKLKENTTYYLYCPNTGDPAYPEFIAEVVNKGGSCYIVPASDLVLATPPPAYSNIVCTVFANPGFSSTWFLFSKETGEKFLWSFAYKRISASLSTGETLLLCKKEPGGNIIDIWAFDFPPNKAITIKSRSEGEQLEYPCVTTANGSFCIPNFITGVKGKEKGKNHISVLWDDHVLEASVDWDTSSLNIKRVQPQLFF